MSDAREPARDRTEAEVAAAEMRMTAGRLHEMADQAEAGRNDVRIDPSGFHALAYYMESWSLSIDQTCEFEDGAFWNGRYAYGLTCSRCHSRFGEETAGQWSYCPNCGARVVRPNGD